MSSGNQGGEGKRPRKRKRRFRWLLYTFLFLFGIGIGGLTWGANFAWKAYQTLPAYEEFDPSLTSVIYDSKGNKVYELADDQNRTLIKLKDVPEHVQLALIATEDIRFREHFGVDMVRFFGAVWSNVKYYLGVEGAQFEGFSTITMQLTRNAFLTRDQTLMRKLQEVMIAVQLERRFTKDEILEKYLNQVDFGQQAAGIEAAAQTYFAKSARDLTINEGALLIGILKATSQYDPFVNWEGANNRRKVVLGQMEKYGFIDPVKAAELKSQEPVLKRAEVTPRSVTFTGDWYVDYVLAILTDNPPGTAARYGTPVFDPKDLYHKGLKIYTALDTEIQRVADDRVKKLMPVATEEYGADPKTETPQAAVVVMNHQTGEVKALTGGLEHNRMLGYNRSVQAYRQPGSAIKPLVSYLPAIDLLGWGPATVIDDSPPRLAYPKQDHVWPENYDFIYSGLKPMRYGLEQSINAMAVRALEAVTPRKGIEYARKLGLSRIVDASMGPQNDENLALALGGLTAGVTPLDMAQAYGTLGSLGMRVDPVVITQIKNKHGEIIYQANPRKQQVVPRESTWLMVDIMKGSILRGTAAYESKGFKGWPAAGKTGTTEDWHDAWFVGFTPEIVTAVWTGYDNEQGRKALPKKNDWQHWTGAGPPTRIWTSIMSEIIKEKPADWQRPQSIVWAEVCRTSGKLPSPLCPKDDIGGDWFRKEFVPRQVDDVWTLAKVVRLPFLDPRTNKQVVDSRTKKPVEKYYLWKEGCLGTPENLLLIRRPSAYVQHPKDPWNFGRYWPQDWWREVPTEACYSAQLLPENHPLRKPPEPATPTATPTGTQPAPGTGQPGTGTQKPGTAPPPAVPTTPPPGT